MKKRPIDTAWFLAKIEAKGLSIHTLVGKVEGLSGKLTYSNLHRMIHGQRAMSLSEACQLSDILGVPLEELARRALGKKR